jgi:hypothetical protein
MTRPQSPLFVALCSLLALSVVEGLALSVVEGQQARDTAVVPSSATGTGVISGTVVTDDSEHKPVRRATVTLGGADVVNGRGQGPRQAMTDEQGRFLFSSLPAATFSVTASKPGFLTGYYGARRPGRGPSAPVVLAAGQKVTDVSIVMAHGAAITGVVADQNGRPQPDVRVNVYESRIQNGERTYVNASGNSSGVTDDRGVYRVWGLQGGTFIVSASPQSVNTSSVVRLIGADEMQWADQQLKSAPSTSAPSPGSTPAATATAGPPAPQPGRAVTYSAVYYPGTTDPASATAVTVGPGEERGSVNFSLPLVPTSKIEGQIVGPDGQPMAANVQLMMTLLQGVTVSGMPNVTRSSAPDRTGKFTIAAAPPGSYRLMARVQGRGATPPGMPPPPPPPPPPPVVMNGTMVYQAAAALSSAAPAQDLWASVDINVDGQDISDLVLSMRPGMTVSGRVAFEPTTLERPTDLTKVRITFSAVSSNGMQSIPSASAKADGTFQLSGAMPGKYRVGSSVSIPVQPGNNGNAPYWSLKSAMFNGRDLLDGTLEVKPDENVQGLVLTYTDRSTELSGSLVDAAGKPASGYVVLVITTDRSLWPGATRRIRLIRPTFDGKYRTTALPPGEYAIGAITDLDPPDMGDTSFLEQVVAASLKFTLGEGEKKTQDLRLRGGG